MKKLDKNLVEKIGDMAINIIIDDKDGRNQVFVEVENDKGESLKIGTRSDYDRFIKIRISVDDIVNHVNI